MDTPLLTRNVLGHFRQTLESMSAMLGVGEAGATCSQMASVHKDTCCLGLCGVLSFEFEFEWESASKTIFRARTYECITL